MERRKFFWLFLAFFISGVLGLSVRIIFSPQQIKTWLEQKLNKDSEFIEFAADTIELSLARGSVPHIALRAVNLKIAQNDSCLRNTHWHLDEVFIPLRLTSLIQGRIEMGDISANKLSLSIGSVFSESSCYRSSVLLPPNSLQNGKKNLDESTSKSKGRAKTLLDFISGFRVQNLHIQMAEWPGLQIKMSDVAFTVLPDRVVFGADATVETEAIHELAWPVVRLAGEVNSHTLDLAISGRWQEGIINLTAQLLRENSQQLNVKGHIKHLPLANFLKIYEQNNLQKFGSYPRSMWLSCHLGLTSSVATLKDATLWLKECLVEGDAGMWESPTLQLDLRQWVLKEPFEIRISQLPLKILLTILDRDVLGGILNQYGQLSGKVEVRPTGVMSFDGFLEDAEIYFSNAGVRGHQGVRRARVQLEKREGRISGLFSEFELRHGQMKGQISLNFDKKFRDGHVQVKAQDLYLDPAVQELLVKEKLGRIEAFGKFKISNGRFEVFNGELGIDQIENQEIRVKTFKASTSYMGQTLSAKVSTQLLALNSGSQFYEFLKPLLLDKKNLDSWVEMSDLAVELSGYKQYVEWKRGRAQILKEKVILSSEGTWQEGVGLSGWISVDFPSLKLLRWEVSGEVLKPRLLPSSEWLKELVKEKKKKSH